MSRIGRTVPTKMPSEAAKARETYRETNGSVDDRDTKLCENCGWWGGDKLAPKAFCELTAWQVSRTGVCDCHVEALPFA